MMLDDWMQAMLVESMAGLDQVHENWVWGLEGMSIMSPS
jgi:hypothetical protein